MHTRLLWPAYLTAADLAHIYHVRPALIHTWAHRDHWRRTMGRPRRYHAGDAQASYDRRMARLNQRRDTMAKDEDGFREVIAPGAFDTALPARVPVTEYPGGPAIEGAEAEVTKDEKGIVVSVTMPAKDSPQGLHGPMSFRLPDDT